LSVNTTLASPLLSRFDLILVLLDSRDIEWDRRVSTHILEDQLNSNYHSADLWTLQILRTYIAYVKTINPELTPAAKEILIAYYKRQRRGFP
jgi:DNA helicase MCM9